MKLVRSPEEIDIMHRPMNPIETEVDAEQGESHLGDCREFSQPDERTYEGIEIYKGKGLKENVVRCLRSDDDHEQGQKIESNLVSSVYGVGRPSPLGKFNAGYYNDQGR